MLGPPAEGPGGGAWGGGGWGDINIHIDINMNIDIPSIINMNIEYCFDYYTLLMPNFKEQVQISQNM